MKKDLFSEIWKIKEIVKSRVRMMTRHSITPLTLFMNLCCKSAETAAAGSINGSPSQVHPGVRKPSRYSPGERMRHLWAACPDARREMSPHMGLNGTTVALGAPIGKSAVGALPRRVCLSIDRGDGRGGNRFQHWSQSRPCRPTNITQKSHPGWG